MVILSPEPRAKDLEHSAPAPNGIYELIFEREDRVKRPWRKLRKAHEAKERTNTEILLAHGCEGRFHDILHAGLVY